jgi:tetratricopeptide (TPR) repeat protein
MSDDGFSPSRLARLLSALRAAFRRDEQRERFRRDLFLGAPALLCILAVIVALFWVPLVSGREVAAQYRLKAWKAQTANDHAAARLCYERLVRENPADQQSLFALAQVLAEMGDAPSSLELLDRLAPLDKTGFAPAHLALGKQLLAATRPSPQSVHAAEQHLLRAVAAQPDSAEAHALLGRLYALAGRWELAQPHLAAALKNSDELALLMAQVTAAMGHADEAKAYARRAVAFWTARAQAAPTDVAARLAWAQSLLALDDFAGALAVLDRAIVAIADEPRLRLAAASICAGWIEQLQKSASPDTALGLALLARGLKYDPAQPALLNHLIALSHLPGARSDSTRKLLNNLLAQGHESAILHLALGSDALARGQLEPAQVHFERAWALDSHLPQVANNLAWLLAFGDKPDLARAQSLIKIALQSDPTNPHFRDTQGQIHAKLGHWKEAIANLEAALPALADPRRAHAALAESYDHLGMADLAAAHRRQLQELQAGNKGDTPAFGSGKTGIATPATRPQSP